MNPPKILAFGGSLRTDSFNQTIASVIAEGARNAGASVTLVSLRDFPMPLYNPDLETIEGMPSSGKKLKDLFLSHDGLIVASPEYNGSFTGVLKNAFDWVSRATRDGERPLAAISGKTAAIASASPTGLGGSRSLDQFRQFLKNIRVTVLENQITVPKAHEQILPSGGFTDPGIDLALRALGAELVTTMMAESIAAEAESLA